MATARNPEEILAELLASGIDPAEIQRKARGAKVQAVREHFCQHLKNEDSTPSIRLQVDDWKDVMLFLKEENTPEHNVAGPLFTDIVADAKAAITDKDAERFLDCLLMIFKANQHAG